MSDQSNVATPTTEEQRLEAERQAQAKAEADANQQPSGQPLNEPPPEQVQPTNETAGAGSQPQPFQAPTDQSGAQSPTGQTLRQSMQSGRDPSSSGKPRGLTIPTDKQTYTWTGDMASAPEWIDRGWASYDAGPALAVPRGDPNASPYTTVSARVGDTVVYTPPKGRGGGTGTYTVVRAEESGEQPGAEPLNLGAGDRSTPTFRPAAQTEATLEDLVKTGMVSPDEMDPEARAQYEARRAGTGPASAEQAGHIPSE
jgi:hypothetical protein